MLLPSRAKQANLKSRVVLQVSEVPGRQKTELCLLFRAKIHRRHMHHGKPRQNHTFCVCCFSSCRKESSANFTGFKNLLLRVKHFFSWASQLASQPNRSNQNIHPWVSNFTVTWSDNWRTCAGNIQGCSQQISCSPFCLPSWQDLLSCSRGSLAFTGKQNDGRNLSEILHHPQQAHEFHLTSYHLGGKGFLSTV